jgi:hypothetical protein
MLFPHNTENKIHRGSFVYIKSEFKDTELKDSKLENSELKDSELK